MPKQRSASANDVAVAIEVLGLHGHLPYADAVAAVAEARHYTRKAVYGIVNRARNDKRTVGGVALYRQQHGEALSAIAHAFEMPVTDVKQAIRAYQRDEQRKAVETDALQEVVPRGHYVKGVSKLLDADGNVMLSWVKTDTEKQAWLDIMNAILDSIPQRIEPRAPVAQADSAFMADMLSVYVVADLHIGLYASAMDAERDWRLSDAVATTKYCIDDLISRTPPTQNAIVANIGDFTHVDNGTNRTPRSGAALDADGRYIEIVQAAMELAVFIVDRAAEHHQHVTVVWQPGNHDEATGVVIQTALALLYRDDARVSVIQSGKRTWCTQWGLNALGFTHGDTIKHGDLPLIMANDYPAIWAATKRRVWHVGHIHHLKTQEHIGCTVEAHQSPAPRDGWHEESGYRSGHSMTAIVYSQRGEYSRNVVQVEHAGA